MQKRTTKICGVLLAVIFLVSCTCPAFATADATYTQEQTWVNVTTGETIVIPPMKVSENSYIPPTLGTQTSSLLPAEAEVSPLTLIGPDGRYEVESPNIFPFTAVVRLTITFPSGNKGDGTGFFVAPNIIMTAGHNLIYPGIGVAQSIVIDPSGSSPAYTPSEVNCLTLPAWSNDFNPDYDYGLIVLGDDSIGNSVGTLGLSARSDAQLNNLIVAVCGFPLEANGALWEHVRYIQTYSAKRIWYDVDATIGQSGAPVWLMADRSTVIGIHTAGYDENDAIQYNSGIRITTDIISAVNYYKSDG